MYGSAFYESQKGGSKQSAEVILPYVKDICDPSSVIDVGCGVGTWLAVWVNLGVENVLGLDGNWVDLDQLMISQQSFQVYDITEGDHSFHRYDLVQCLEVAEHIDVGLSDRLVSLLCTLSDAVLFSAAIPGQGGTDHVNEQWHDYWHNKFAAHEYKCFDILRPKYWDNQKIAFWYRQNMFIYINKNNKNLVEHLQAERQFSANMSKRIVHPEQFSRTCNKLSQARKQLSRVREPSLRTAIKMLSGATARSVKKRIRKAREYLN